MTWWTLTSMYLGPGHISAALNCRTSAPDHLWVAYAPWRPARTALWRMFRGSEHLCGYKYTWDTPLLVEQTLPGDTDFHLFVLSDLTPITTYWGYMFAPDGPYGQEIQGPMFHFTTAAIPPGPQPTDTPIHFYLLNRHMRCGNHYTWWANGTWYAMVPSIDSITVWKLQGGVMVRKDHAHEPVAPAGFINDADSRMQPDAETLHCAYFCRVALPGPHLLRYATFDLTTDLWAIDEPICNPDASGSSAGHCSLSLDGATVPHVAYTRIFNLLPYIAYRNRTGGAWSARETALYVANKILDNPSVDHAPADNSFHLMCVSSWNVNYVNRRTAAGAWDGQTYLPVQGINISDHSISTPVALPHFGQIRGNWRVNHHEGVPPYSSQLDLTAPVSRWANMLPGPLIVFRNASLWPAHVYRPPAADWDAEVQVPYGACGMLCATFAAPDVASFITTHSGDPNIGFYAFLHPGA